MYLQIVKEPGGQQHQPGSDMDRFTYYGCVSTRVWHIPYSVVGCRELLEGI